MNHSPAVPSSLPPSTVGRWAPQAIGVSAMSSNGPQGQQFDQRIVARQVVDPVGVTWVLEVKSARWWRLLSRPRVVERPGRILEVSVTGAEVEGPSDPVLPIGAMVTVRVRGEDSTVTVRRSSASDRAGTRRYGVEFKALGPALREQISSTLGRGTPPVDSWMRAR
jgi:hypothetical protein